METYKPIISFVIVAKNDDYMGNFRYRIETALNYTAQEMDRAGHADDVEILIVDWGSYIPLHAVLNLSNVARRIVRFILVPSPIAERCNQDSDLAISIAINAGIRRAAGEFIAITSGDIIQTGNFVQNFLDSITESRQSDKALYFVRLRHIPVRYIEEEPDLRELEHYVLTTGHNLPLQPFDPPFLMGSAGTLLMHRNLWLELRGLDERLIYWGWSDIDLALRVRLKYACLDFTDLAGAYVYHLQHGTPGINTHKNNSPRIVNPFVVNNHKWGLVEYVFDEYPVSVPFETETNSECEFDPDRGNSYLYYLKHMYNTIKFIFVECRDSKSFRVALWTMKLIIIDAIKKLLNRRFPVPNNGMRRCER